MSSLWIFPQYLWFFSRCFSKEAFISCLRKVSHILVELSAPRLMLPLSFGALTLSYILCWQIVLYLIWKTWADLWWHNIVGSPWSLFLGLPPSLSQASTDQGLLCCLIKAVALCFGERVSSALIFQQYLPEVKTYAPAVMLSSCISVFWAGWTPTSTEGRRRDPLPSQMTWVPSGCRNNCCCYHC